MTNLYNTDKATIKKFNAFKARVIKKLEKKEICENFIVDSLRDIQNWLDKNVDDYRENKILLEQARIELEQFEDLMF